MPSCVESLYLFRERAWHGLGTVCEEAKTSKEALEIAGLNWTVIQKPVFVDNNVVPGYVANVRDSDNSVLGIVTPKYKIVQNNQAFEFTDSLLGTDGITYESAGSLKNGKTVFLLAHMPKTKILGDDIDNYLCFCNSHDGTGAVKVCSTNVRVVCNNTLNIALNTAKRSWTTRHMGNIEDKLEEAYRTLDLAFKYQEELGKFAEQAVEYKIDMDKTMKMLNQLFPIKTEDSDRKQNNMKRNQEAFEQCIYAVDLSPFVGTGWGLINAAADFADHVTPGRLTNTYRERNFEKVINGHPILDQVSDFVMTGMEA